MKVAAKNDPRFSSIASEDGANKIDERIESFVATRGIGNLTYVNVATMLEELVDKPPLPQLNIDLMASASADGVDVQGCAICRIM